MMLLSFLDVGAIGFWVLLLLSAFVVSSLVDDDHPFGATLVALGTFALLALLGNLNPIALVRAHPHEALLAIPAYLAAGVLWCYVKWVFHVDGKSRKARAAIAAFEDDMAKAASRLAANEANLAAQAAARRSPDATGRSGWARGDEALSRLEADVAERREHARSDEWRAERLQQKFREAGLSGTGKPLVRENKARIVAWMSYWPASMAWTLIDDPVRRIFMSIYESIGGSLQRISDRRFAGIEDAYKAHAGKTGR